MSNEKGRSRSRGQSATKIGRFNQPSNSSVLTTKPPPKKIVVKEVELKPSKVSLEEQGCKHWQASVESQASVFTDALMGQLLSTIICKSCQFASHTFESFFVLELPLPMKSRASLRQCFEEYCHTEDLADPWGCPKCKAKQPATKTLRVWRLPPVLIICFKRFTEQVAKNDCLVSINLAGEDLEASLAPGAKTSRPPGSQIYEPFGFVVRSVHAAPHWDADQWPLHILSAQLP